MACRDLLNNVMISRHSGNCRGAVGHSLQLGIPCDSGHMGSRLLKLTNTDKQIVCRVLSVGQSGNSPIKYWLSELICSGIKYSLRLNFAASKLSASTGGPPSLSAAKDFNNSPISKRLRHISASTNCAGVNT
ncbi:hypothetical protein ElyMa_000019200 [Elysia marginata]|uniref:Uncharacterized protein n=1 Tax=Elysia marginata TaxID=1093978 RepID=A0AAV4EBJ7_9GAST|nr:hypothetical protein ElyMa_000019200 [Elysia marginata]